MTDLSMFLRGRGELPTIGAETGRTPRDGIAVWRSKIQPGSHRYVYFEQGEPLAALQIVGERGGGANVANVYTRPDARRRGLATKLLERACKDFAEIEHSEHLSDEGRAWTVAQQRRSAARLAHP